MNILLAAVAAILTVVALAQAMKNGVAQKWVWTLIWLLCAIAGAGGTVILMFGK